MREIKIRAWDKTTKKMLEWDWVRKCESPFYAKHEEGTCLLDELEFKLMQFTGLHDKNGKEIYEGDVVKYEHEDGVVTAKIVYKMADCESMLISGFYFEMISMKTRRKIHCMNGKTWKS